jgi:hypothetical protein
MELAAINGPVTALVAGLVTSLHCAGMCGPLACAIMPGSRDRHDATTVSTVYHLSRLGGYALLGAAAGGLGRLPLTLLDHSALRYLPWLLVVFFLAVAVRFDRRLPKVPLLGRGYAWLMEHLRGGSRLRAAAVLGLGTPLLPCGPLYFLIALATMAGSAARGAEVLLAFGLGTVPLLWVAQANFGWLRTRLGPAGLARAQTALAVAAALILSWRLRSTLGFEGPAVGNFVCF